MLKLVVMPLCLPVLLMTSSSLSAKPIHLWHLVQKPSAETWSGRAVITSASEGYYFTDADKNDKGAMYDFIVDEFDPFKFGFGFDKTDYDMSYSVTLTQKPSTFSPSFISRTCMFTITATGPAKHDVRVNAYNGANCQYSVSGHHVYFTVS